MSLVLNNCTKRRIDGHRRIVIDYWEFPDNKYDAVSLPVNMPFACMLVMKVVILLEVLEIRHVINAMTIVSYATERMCWFMASQSFGTFLSSVGQLVVKYIIKVFRKPMHLINMYIQYCFYDKHIYQVNEHEN